MFSRRKTQELTEQITRLMDENKMLSDRSERLTLENASRKAREQTLQTELETLQSRFEATQHCIEFREEYIKCLESLLEEVAPGLLKARIEAGRATHTQWQPRRRTPRRPK